MKRNIILSSIALLTFVSVFSIQAKAVVEDTTVTPTEPTTTTTTTTISPTVTRTGLLKDTVKETMQLKREDFRTATVAQKAQMRTDMKARRAEFKTKMDAIKDVRKQAILDRFDEKVSNFNQQHTDKLNTNLTRMDGILTEIKTKADAAKAKGTDVTEVESAIASAEAAVETAKTSVAAQLDMDYVIDFQDETGLRAAATATFTQFQTDMKEVHTAVINAYTAIVKAARELAKVSKDTAGPTGSSPEADQK